MSKSSIIHARVEPEVKQEAEQIFKELGLSTTQAITIFYHMVVLSHGLPFDVKIPEKKASAESLVDFFQSSPHRDLDLKFSRKRDYPRKINL